MRRCVLAVLFGLCLMGNGSAQAAYDHASGAPGPGAGEYSASITGVQATTDVIFVLDNSWSVGDKWASVSAATAHFVEQLEADGLFARGGRVGVVLFSTGTSDLAPTAERSAIDQKIAEGTPSGESCIACGLKRAAELLSAIPGSSGHRRLIYLLADGRNTVTPPTVKEALAADDAVGAVRRVIGVGPESSVGSLAELDSDGAVTYAESEPALLSAYAAEPTTFSGATNISWAFHLTWAYVPSTATASLGSATISGSDVIWTIPSLGAETATLSIHASRSATSSGCDPMGFLAGTSFSDAEGDAAPTLPPEVIPVAAPCVPRIRRAVRISLPKAPKKCWRRRSLTVKVSGARVAKTVVKVSRRKAKTYRGKSARGRLKVAALPKGSYKVRATVTLDDGRTKTLTRSYRTCAAKRKR
jgi:hypothetical protein